MLPAKQEQISNQCQYENCRNRWTVARGDQRMCSSHTWTLLLEVKKTPEIHNRAMDTMRQILPRIGVNREPGDDD